MGDGNRLSTSGNQNELVEYWLRENIIIALGVLIENQNVECYRPIAENGLSIGQSAQM